MPEPQGAQPDPREQDIVYGDRRLSRPDSSLPDWEVPDTTYRPIPIVWFTGAMAIQIVVLPLLLWLLVDKHGAFSLAAMALATFAIGYWTWQRGMALASNGWKLATIATMTLCLAMYGVLPLDRL